MASSSLVDEYMSPLLAGNRVSCRDFIQRQMENVRDISLLYTDLVWPAMERVEKLYRSDRINVASEHMATRINRTIADQLQPKLKRAEPNGKKLVVTCADGETEELGAQMTVDLFESRGWEVYFLGAGVPNDEILSLVGQLRPDVLLVFGAKPSGVPGVRQLVDLIRNIGINPTMNIMVSGGVFNRADALWKEVNAELFASSAQEAIRVAEAAEPRIPTPIPTGPVKKRRRRRKPPLLATPEAQ